MSKSNGNKEAKLKASMEELVGPLLKRIMGGKGPKNQETIEKLGRLVEATKRLVASRQTSESDFIGCFGAIEREIDHCECEENNQLEEESWAELTKKLEELLEKHRVDLSAVSTNCSPHQDQERTSAVPIESMNFEHGKSSNSNNQETAGLFQYFEEYMRELKLLEWYAVNSLSIFPENAILKKSFLFRWWWWICRIHETDLLFSNLVCGGMLEPAHTKKHNQIIDQWTVNPTFYRHLKQASVQSENRVHEQPSQINYVKLLSLVEKYSLDRKKAVLLNENQKYLSSKYLKNVLQDLDAVILGKWPCTDLEPQDHIEVDDTNFLKHLGKVTQYLSLRGISRIEEIPQSIGKLPHLKILDLRACHNLEKLPEKPQSKLHKVKWFQFLSYLDVSECYLLDHMPYWICELSWLNVLKGFVVGSVKKKQSCRLRDLSRLEYLQKLSIRIAKNLDHKDAGGLKSMSNLSVLTVIWAINEQNYENDGGKVPTISFPETLEKLDLICYPEAEAVELSPAALPNLKSLYIRNGKLSKIETGSGWKELEILRLRFLENLKMDWESELCAKFSKLKYLEYIECPLLKTFPENTSIYNMKEHMKHDGEISKHLSEHLKENNADAVDLKIIQKSEAPLEKNEIKLVLQLTGGIITDSPRLALVAVLDVSRSMKAGNKLKKLKAAMLFVINKLSCLDYFAIVLCSTKSYRDSPELLQITESHRQQIEDVLNSLEAEDTNYYAGNLYQGLRRGLNLMHSKKHLESQMTKCIILVSGGRGESCYDSCTSTDFRSVSVHTFGFGRDHDPTDLKSIAYYSSGGTYSDVRNTNNLTKAFAVCLAGVHSVAAQDLTLTIRSCKPPLPVSFGGYQRYRLSWEKYDCFRWGCYENVMGRLNFRRMVNDDGSVTINFGNIYSGEVQKVLVYHLLPSVDEELLEHVLKVSYSYKLSGETCEANRVIDVKRVQTVPSNPQLQWDIIAEETRLKIVKMVEEAIELADENDLEGGRVKITDAQNILKDVETNLGESNESFGLFPLLKAELEELIQMMESKELYTRRHAFAYSFLSSHDRQRATARGDDIEKVLSYATPSMSEFLKEAKEFDAKHSIPLAPADGDAES